MQALGKNFEVDEGIRDVPRAPGAGATAGVAAAAPGPGGGIAVPKRDKRCDHCKWNKTHVTKDCTVVLKQQLQELQQQNFELTRGNLPRIGRAICGLFVF